MNNEELTALEHDPEREREELMQVAEHGRKYRVANEVLSEVLEEQKANVVRQLESADFERDNDAIGLVLYLRVLRVFSDTIRTRIDEGEMAEKELMADGD